jgi:hypothetical protein
MNTYTLLLVAYIGGLFVSNTTGLDKACCGDEGYFSLSLGPGTYTIEYPPHLKRLMVYSEVPYQWVMELTNPKSTIKFTYDNIMFYADEAAIVKLTKVSN